MSHGTLLGRTGAELAVMLPDSRGWHFMPTEAFEPVRTLFVELQETTLGMQELLPAEETLAAMREEERAAFVHRALMSDPRAPRFMELMETLDELGLELRDEDGVPLDTRTLGVTELELTPQEYREMMETIDPGNDAAQGARPPYYLLVAGV